MKKVILILMLLLFIVSCKNESKINETEKPSNQAKTEKVSEQLEIEFRFKTNKKDVFKIMMNNIEVDELQKKNIHFFETVEPTSNYDYIDAKFDEGNMSKKITINLGDKKIKTVEIQSINISYKNNVINISSHKDINKYLRFNKYIERDSASSIIKTKKVKGQHKPAITFSKKLINEIKK